jgi:predicted NBD/HSP70 family sugar kinase
MSTHDSPGDRRRPRASKTGSTPAQPSRMHHPRPRETKLAAKRSQILYEVFRRGQCSRFDLARRLNINATAVGGYVDEFLGAGLLLEGSPIQSRPGRAPVPLRINPEHGCFLGLEFEALRARAVLCDFAGGVLHQEEVPLKVGVTRDAVLRAVVALARAVAARATTRLWSVGVAAPGVVDAPGGRILHYGLLPDFDQVPVRERFADAFDVPVFVEHNIRALTYAELLRGSARGTHHVLCLAVRSGVALGIVVDGKLYDGTHAMAGEAGYMVFPTSNGPQRVSDLVSATGFVDGTRAKLAAWQRTPERDALLAKGDELTLTDVCAAADAGDPLLHSQLAELGTHLGMLAANLANVFAPEKIILTGEVPRCSPVVRQTMERTFRKCTLPHILHFAYLEDGVLGSVAGALGAAWMGFARAFPDGDEAVQRSAKRAESMSIPAAAAALLSQATSS